ncbi:MAG: hypothetical protein ACKVRP_05420 [Bacteroidota bacterium]
MSTVEQYVHSLQMKAGVHITNGVVSIPGNTLELGIQSWGKVDFLRKQGFTVRRV